MSRKDIGKIVELMKNDFKSVFANPIVTLLIVAIIILPSLYALINVEACWDPYSNTDEVDFAIANLDNGTSFQGLQLNIGNELVKELKNNSKFDWKFVTEDELRDGVNKGDYYAGIIIPKNLSENIVSITGDNPKQAKLEYVVNIKANPVASRLTDAGANAIYTSLNAKIVELIDLAAYGKLGELQEGLASGASQLGGGAVLLQSGASQVAAGASQVAAGEKIIKNGSAAVKQGSSQIKQGAKNVSQGANKVQQGSEELQGAVDPSLMPEGAIKEYAKNSAALANGSSELAKGSNYLAGNSSLLADGSSQLADGSLAMAEGSLSLAAGAELLGNSAAQALFAASGALAASANSLASVTGINETQLGDYLFSPIKLAKFKSPFYL